MALGRASGRSTAGNELAAVGQLASGEGDDWAPRAARSRSAPHGDFGMAGVGRWSESGPASTGARHSCHNDGPVRAHDRPQFVGRGPADRGHHWARPD